MYGSVAKFSDPNRLFFSGWKATIFFFKVVAADEVGSRIFFSFVRSFDDDDRHTTPKKKIRRDRTSHPKKNPSLLFPGAKACLFLKVVLINAWWLVCWKSPQKERLFFVVVVVVVVVVIQGYGPTP